MNFYVFIAAIILFIIFLDPILRRKKFKRNLKNSEIEIERTSRLNVFLFSFLIIIFAYDIVEEIFLKSAEVEWVNVIFFSFLIYFSVKQMFNYHYNIGLSEEGIHTFKKTISWDKIKKYYFKEQIVNDKDKCIFIIKGPFNLLYSKCIKNLNEKDKEKLDKILNNKFGIQNN
ncbi:MAG: hypothetical protein FXF47_05065 [Candidatus Mcinerneyibacterium aminivorans]|uniref:Uncharacterized protein n=1 Tax=Candidatus Mcinerneyibacterium aminivorans TaxID=2703815 RepID=A0A5D0MJ56_9BACT|nr:MAG: hypothetical protein FXF47_05065 [Candidatus Mcinerneyibacterium aminivorans]